MMTQKRKSKLLTNLREARVFSLNFLDNMFKSGIKSYVPFYQYLKLEKKYTLLFKRYQRETGHFQSK